MRIPSGKTDQKVFFVAVDANDLVTRKTGLTTFTVYRSRNGGTATAMTSPTVTELDASHMPGVYALTMSEDTTIASTSDSEEMAVHITQASMAPVTRTVELYRRDTTSGKTALIDNSGRVDVAAVAGTPQTAKDLGASATQTGDSYARLGAPAGASIEADIAAIKSDSGAIKTKTDSLTFSVAGQVDSNVIDWKGAAAPAMTGDAFARIGAAGAGLTALGDTRIAHLDADVSSRLASSSYTAPTTPPTVSAIRAEMDTNSTKLAHLDADISTRLATSSYAAPDNSSIASIKVKTDNLPASPADESLIIAATNSLATSIAALPTTTTVNAIKTKTDSLAFTVAGQVDANIHSVNDVTVNGVGTSGSPWGP